MESPDRFYRKKVAQPKDPISSVIRSSSPMSAACEIAVINARISIRTASNRASLPWRVPFPFAEYEKMAERLRRLKGRAIVSLNDHPDIRRVFDGFYIETVPIQFTVGVEAVDRNELIIFSWDDAAHPVGLF